MKTKNKYSRVLLKLSGEALSGKKSSGIDKHVLQFLASEIAGVHALGVEIAIVIGAGNIWRGVENINLGIDAASSHILGMLGTIMNGVVLSSVLEKKGIHTRVMSAISVPAVSPQFIRGDAIKLLKSSHIVLCTGGTGNPFFTTDSAGALRSLELSCDVLLKGTNIDGIYDKNPKTNKSAKKYDRISYSDILDQNLKVMDSTAVAQCRDNQMPIIVFELLKKGNLRKVICGEKIGTEVFSEQ